MPCLQFVSERSHRLTAFFLKRKKALSLSAVGKVDSFVSCIIKAAQQPKHRLLFKMLHVHAISPKMLSSIL